MVQENIKWRIIVGVCIVLGLVVVFTILGIMGIFNTNSEENTPEENSNNKFYNVCVLNTDGTYIIYNEKGEEKNGNDAQTMVEMLFEQQVNAEFLSSRVCIFLMPGTHDINIQLGYYMAVIGLGKTPDDVHVNGTITSPNKDHPCVGALDNFFRSISNLTINVPKDKINYFCASQASPVRDIVVNGDLHMAKFQKGCGGPDVYSGGYSSGGYMCNVHVNGTLYFETQQQFFTHNCTFTSAKNGAWNMMYMGCKSDITSTPCSIGKGPLVTVMKTVPGMITTPPRLVFDVVTKKYMLIKYGFISDSSGPVTDNASQTYLPFVFINPSIDINTINTFLATGTNLVFMPGQYYFDHPVNIIKPDTVVMGLGYATINPTKGNVGIKISDNASGVILSGFMIEASDICSPALVEVGSTHNNNNNNNNNNPSVLMDIYPRVGGPTDSASATTMMVINQKNTIIMHSWLWRSDHTQSVRSGLGTDKAKCDHALVVNADDVHIFGLFAEHTLKEGVIWKGARGKLYFLQSEMAYDVVAPWDYPMLRVEGDDFEGHALGVYSFFSRKFNNTSNNAPIVKSAIVTSGKNAQIHSACTVFLNPSTDPYGGGNGTIKHVVNDVGMESNVSNADVAQWIQDNKSCY